MGTVQGTSPSVSPAPAAITELWSTDMAEFMATANLAPTPFFGLSFRRSKIEALTAPKAARAAEEVKPL